MSIILDNREVVATAKGGLEVFRGMLSDFPADIIAQAAAYGIHKKCQDASGGDGVTGADAKAKAAAVIAAFKAGTWAQRGGGGPRAGNEDDFVLARLIAKLKADAKAKRASAPTDEVAKATAAAIMRSQKPDAVTLVNGFRSEWKAKHISISDLVDEEN